jgi:multiple sugar transport system permease protein
MNQPYKHAPWLAQLRRKPSLTMNMWGYLFIAPWLIGFIIFTVGPFLVSLYLGFTKYSAGLAPEWIGLQNYYYLFSGLWSDAGDTLAWRSLFNTLYYTLFHVPLSLIMALMIAMLLNTRVQGQAFYRTLFYLPSVTSGVASAILWLWLLNPNGLVNYFLALVGISPGPRWFGSTQWAMPGLIIMSLWSIGNIIIIYLAGLQGIPQQLYEAAVIDGANLSQSFFYITLPMLTPTIFFTTVIGLIAAFQIFTPAFVITNGGPANATLFYLLYLYRNGFQWFQMGYASALAWFLFVIIMVFSLIQFRLADRWVYYEGQTSDQRG